MTETDSLLPCRCCNYSVKPVLHETERKHFDAHAFECVRCLFRPETMPTVSLAVKAWNQRTPSAADNAKVEALEAIKYIRPVLMGLRDISPPQAMMIATFLAMTQAMIGEKA